MLVLDKPPGVIVHQAPSVSEPTLVSALLSQGYQLSSLGAPERAGIVHRLDKETSGLLVLAKNDEAHLFLQKKLQEKKFTKKYLALVWGIPAKPYGEIRTGYGRHPVKRHKMAVLPLKKGKKEAVSYYQVLQTGKAVSLLEVILFTGRTHQIRVHLSYSGYPVLGDKVYGKKEDAVPRQMLHAYSLLFPHPQSGKLLSFFSPLPQDFQETMLACHLDPQKIPFSSGSAS